MPQHYARIAFTDEVEAAQETYGSRAAMHRFADAEFDNDTLGPAEREFIAGRDGFYLATAGSTGWPYVQYRGGPPGFLAVVDDRTLAWADLRGNRQYISTGNLAGNDRASLFLMDYARQRRLKIYGRVDVLDPAGHPDLRDRLVAGGHPAHVERLVRVRVAAFDWNCPQHITRRFTAAELEPALAPLHDELESLRRENAGLRARLARTHRAAPVLGADPGS
jgi:hypothetical protein